jgi:hypothetical protein
MWRFGESRDFPASVGARNARVSARAIERGERGRAERVDGRSGRAAERGEDDRGRTHVDAKQADVAGVEGEPFSGSHEALDLVLVGEVDVGVLVAAADLFETDHRARKRAVSRKRSSVEAKGVSVTPAVALRCDRDMAILTVFETKKKKSANRRDFLTGCDSRDGPDDF